MVQKFPSEIFVHFLVGSGEWGSDGGYLMSAGDGVTEWREYFDV